MIDLERAEKAFQEYLNDYDIDDIMINRKRIHTYEVVKHSENIAKELGLDEENIQLAKLIALLHDIGRFEQAKVTGTYVDSKKFNHAEYGVKILFEYNLIRSFILDNKYDNIIYKAILNHSRYEIEEGLSEIELLHSKLIRDSDKLDLFRVKETEEFEPLFKKIFTINETITDEVYYAFMNKKTVLNKYKKTQLDIVFSFVAFIFDLNFDISLKYIKDENYVNRLIDRVEYTKKDTKEKIERMRECVINYLEERTKVI